MKKGLLLLLFISAFIGADAQYTNTLNKGYQFKYVKVDSGLALPYRQPFNITWGTTRPGTLICNPVDSLLYMWNGLVWKKAGLQQEDIPVNTFQDVLIAGSDLSQDNTVNASSHKFNIDSLNTFRMFSYGTEQNAGEGVIIKNLLSFSDDANQAIELNSAVSSLGVNEYQSRFNVAPAYIGMQSDDYNGAKTAYLLLDFGSKISMSADSAVFIPAIPDADSSRQLATTKWVKKNISTANNYADAKVADAINDGVTTVAPSQNAVFDALALKQNSLGFTPENVANKENVTINNSTVKYPTVNLLKTGLDTKLNISDTAAMLAPYLLEVDLPVITASNMLTKNGNNIKFGGAITEDTYITGDYTKDIDIDGISTFGVTAQDGISLNGGDLPNSNFLYGDWEVDGLLRAFSDFEVNDSSLFHGFGLLDKKFNYSSNIGGSFTARSLIDKGYADSSINLKVSANAAITGATKTKITYDAKGLVTAGADATTTDIAEGTNLYFTPTRVTDITDLLYDPLGTASSLGAFKVTKGGDAGALTIGTNDATDFNFETNNTTRWTIDGSAGYLRRGGSTADFGLHLFGTGQGSVVALGDRFDASTPYVGLREKGGTDTDQMEAYGQKGFFVTTGTYGGTSKLTVQQDGDIILGGETQVAGAELTVIGDEDVSGNLNVQGDLTAANIYKGSATLDFPSTGATAVSNLTVTVTGAAVGDPVFLGVPNGSLTTTATYWAWVSSANTVTVRYSPKATENPASGTFKVKVFKY